MAKGKTAILLNYLELNSIVDLARLAYNFDYTSKNIFFDSTSNKLFILGEKIQDFTLIYYVKINGSKNFLKYTPPTPEKVESAELTDEKLPDDMSSFYINVIKLSIAKLSNNSSKKIKLTNVQIDNFSDIIKLLLSKSHDDSKISRIYSFNDKKNAYLFGFDLVDFHTENKVLFFSKSDLNKNKNSNFFAYDYKENSVLPVDTLGGHQYLYTKLINLKEKPEFLQQ